MSLSRLRAEKRVSPKAGGRHLEGTMLTVKTPGRKGRVSLVDDGEGGDEHDRGSWEEESDNQDYLFTIKHYAATVLYNTRDWSEKNKDT
jgi:hypothetical protein